MKLERAGRYFAYAVALFGSLLVSQQIIETYQKMASTTYNTYPFIYALIACSIFMGFLIGLDVLLGEAKKKGRWKINFEKFIFIAFPASFFIFKNFIPLPEFMSRQVLPPPFMFYVNPEMLTVFAVILGYSFCTGFYKDKS
ncbi:MAG: hypothetical protein GX996_07305 [Firmicutes bacterium]|mgnify:CR=1 FL=1|nr:hypothetical protein [Bacillota bacterium]